MRDRFPLIVVFGAALLGVAGYFLFEGASRGSFADALSTYRSRADGARRLGQAVLTEGDGLGEGIVLVSRTRNEDLPACVRKLRAAGLPVAVVAVATHTYRTPPGTGGAAQSREAEFLRFVDRLEAAGAAVRVVSHPVGVAGLSAAKERGALQWPG